MFKQLLQGDIFIKKKKIWEYIPTYEFLPYEYFYSWNKKNKKDKWPAN